MFMTPQLQQNISLLLVNSINSILVFISYDPESKGISILTGLLKLYFKQFISPAHYRSLLPFDSDPYLTTSSSSASWNSSRRSLVSRSIASITQLHSHSRSSYWYWKYYKQHISRGSRGQN